MTTVAVGDELDQERALVGVHPLLRPLGRLVDGDDVHAIHLDAGNNVATLVVLGVHRATLRRGTHTVLVVLANENAWQVPKLGLYAVISAPPHRVQTPTYHVVRLEHLALVARTVTVHRERRVLLAEVLLRKGETSAERNLRTDDTVPALERLGEDVHRTTLALGDTADATEKLADEALDVAAAEADEGVRAIGRDDVVVERRRRVDTNRDVFLRAQRTTAQL